MPEYAQIPIARKAADLIPLEFNYARRSQIERFPGRFHVGEVLGNGAAEFPFCYGGIRTDTYMLYAQFQILDRLEDLGHDFVQFIATFCLDSRRHVLVETTLINSC